MDALAKRFDDRVRQTTDKLIALHGLSGRANELILARLAGEFHVDEMADVGTSGALGGIVGGALLGLKADLAAGGLTLGAGTLIGGIVGALGGAGAAHAYNVARGKEQGTVGWSRVWLKDRPRAALLRYLAVAHYGRGRGDWVEGEYPAHWQALAEQPDAAPWARVRARLGCGGAGGGAGRGLQNAGAPHHRNDLRSVDPAVSGCGGHFLDLERRR